MVNGKACARNWSRKGFFFSDQWSLKNAFEIIIAHSNINHGWSNTKDGSVWVPRRREAFWEYDNWFDHTRTSSSITLPKRQFCTRRTLKTAFSKIACLFRSLCISRQKRIAIELWKYQWPVVQASKVFQKTSYRF